MIHSCKDLYLIAHLLRKIRSRLFNILLIGGHGSRTNMAGKKRKKDSNSDEETVTLKICRKSENEKVQSVGFGDESTVRTIPSKKDFKRRNKPTFNPVKDNGEIIRKNKKHGARSDTHKHTVKHESKLPTKANRTEILDKKLEARRKRRAKRKVVIKLLNFIS